MKWHLLLPLTTALAGTTIGAAQPREAFSPPRGRSMLTDVGSVAFEPILKASGMSPAGIAALRNTPHLDEQRDAMQAAECAVEKVSRSPLDVTALDRALVQRNAIAAAEAERRRVWLIGLLRRVDARDGAVLLQLVGQGNGPAEAWGQNGPSPGPRQSREGLTGPGERPIGPPPGSPPGAEKARCD